MEPVETGRKTTGDLDVQRSKALRIQACMARMLYYLRNRKRVACVYGLIMHAGIRF